MAGAQAETAVYLCTGCPLGCRLEVDAVDGDVIEVRGHTCKRGERYGRQEYLDPRRPLSTTVWVRGAQVARLPVRSAEAVPRDRLVEVAEALRGVCVEAPVQRGQVVLSDVAGTGVDIVATRSLQPAG